MNNRNSCGRLYERAVREFGVSDSSEFSTGFMVGQCEKVFLGACVAAMFRPDAAELDDRRSHLMRICEIYGLKIFEATYHGKTELWACSQEDTRRVLEKMPSEDTEAWHFIRGILTGCPVDEIDLQFHLHHHK